MRLATMAFGLGFAWTGCGGDAPGGADADTADTDPGGEPDEEAEPETACDDQEDDDGDGATDCDDSDCTSLELCTWPTALDFETLIAFDGNALAGLAGYEDCTVHVTAALERDRAESCPGCDRVFAGPFTFVSDDCPEEFERPDAGGYGIDFRGGETWEVFGRVDGEWTSLGITTDDAGTMRIEETAPVEFEGVEAGELTTRFAFTPR